MQKKSRDGRAGSNCWLALWWCGLLLFSTTGVAAVTVVPEPSPPYRTQRLLLESKLLQQQREIQVRLPAAYLAAQAAGRQDLRFPVLYLLDGEAPNLTLLPGILDALSHWGKAPEVILVSIANIDRNKDFTPVPQPQWPTTGQADAFLDFIQFELQPLINQRYRTAPGPVLLGHSFGGLLATYCMLTRPTMFRAYLTASPYLHYADNLLLQQAAAKLATLPPSVALYTATLGDEPAYQAAWQQFERLLLQHAPASLQSRFWHLPEEDHLSVPGPAYHQALRLWWADWAPQAPASLAELQQHFARRSQLDGYVIQIPELQLHALGQRLLQAASQAGLSSKAQTHKKAEAYAVFLQQARLYPASLRAQDNLAAAALAQQQPVLASGHYRRALELSAATGQQDKIEFYAAKIKTLDERKL